jgi:hypothetical protein
MLEYNSLFCFGKSNTLEKYFERRLISFHLNILYSL